MGDVLGDFREAMAKRGIVPGKIIADGTLHRCDTTARNGQGDAAYVLYLNGIAHGGFQNWQDGEGWEDWQSGDVNGLSWEARQRYHAALQEQRRQRDEETARRREDARTRALGLYRLSLETPAQPDSSVQAGHPYLARKRVGAYGLGLASGSLVVPAWDLDGILHTVQTVAADGAKLYLPGGSIQGHFHVLGVPEESQPLLIAEGYATAASLHEATGYPVVMAFQANNLLPVAKAWREKLPGARIALCADDDWKTVANGRPKNPGVELATEAAQAIGGFLIVPKFSGNRADKDTDFNDLAIKSGNAEVARQIEAVINRRLVRATPFTQIDEASIPRRAWVYGRHLIRRHVSLTIAPGAMGKSSLLIGDAIAMASSKPVMGQDIHGHGLRVWYWNLEDPADELHRRFAAGLKHYQIDYSALEGRLFVDSGRQQSLTVARQDRGDTVILEPIVEALIQEIKERGISVLIVDPFVSCHQVPENDNGAIDAVIKRWAKVADECDCAIELVHHSRKLGGAEATAESSRGAVALLAAARSVRVLNRMTPEEAEEAGVQDKSGHLAYFRVNHDKENLAPATPNSSWFHFLNVELANGDHVGVVEPWTWPDAFEGVPAAMLPRVQAEIAGRGLRYDSRSADWVGTVIANVLGWEPTDPTSRSKVRQMIEMWIENGVLRKVEVADASRRMRVAIEPGRRVEGFRGAVTTEVEEE